jgi:hypothetical protein
LTRGFVLHYINSRLPGAIARRRADVSVLARKDNDDMTHPGTPETGNLHGGAVPHHAGTPAEQTYFSEAEWQVFRQQDLTAAKQIVGLMVGIFITGLILYSGVALWVANRAV